MASHNYQCIFIHIPKTAGTSIEKKLGQLHSGIQDHRTVREIESQFAIAEHARQAFQLDPNVVFKRKDSRSREEMIISQSQFNRYFKFAFVRNSWARAFSYYEDVMRAEIHQKGYGISASCTFKDFLKNHIDIWGMKSQLYWITNKNDEIPLDFIGRFENLEEDFNYVCERLGITDAKLPKLLVRGDRPHYTKVYDEEMKSIVANIYAEEIALFNFEYGD